MFKSHLPQILIKRIEKNDPFYSEEESEDEEVEAR